MATIPNNYAAIWALNPPAFAVSGQPESSFGLGPGGSESVLGNDGRTLVNPLHYADGGKYRSIIKLMIRYENQPNDNNWGMGTGWLIRPDLLVTAGHCAYDFGEERYGRATIVKAYMGYSGKTNLSPVNLNSGAVQLRMGKTFITTTGWLQSEGTNRRTDVAFLKLDRPFTGNFTPVSYVDTPFSGQDIIGVVGYPADKPDGDASQSGSPVIRKSDGISIGAHVYGGTSTNSASSIGGKYGNDFDAYVNVFNQRAQPITSILGISVIKPATAGADNMNITNGGFDSTGFRSIGSFESSTGHSEGTESFLDVLKDIGKVAIPLVSTGLQIASPFLGPVGPPAASIAGVALGALGKMCESAFDSQTQTLRMIPKVTPEQLEGIAQRAVLAEAALQTTLKLDHDSPEGKLILQAMKENYAVMKPQESLPSKLFPCIAVPTLRIAMDPKLPVRSEHVPDVRKALPNSTMTESSFSTSTEAAFARELLQPTIRLPGEEGFFDTLGPIIKSGLKFATPLLSQAAKQGIDFALSSLNKTESAFDTTASDNIIAGPLFRRAVVAECALQAIQKIDPSRLKGLKLYDDHGNESTEGFFDFMKKTMQVVGRKVIETAPDVIKNVGPVALDLLAHAIQQKGGSEGAIWNWSGSPTGDWNGSFNGDSSLTVPFQPVLRPKRSIAALADSRPETPQPVTVSAPSVPDPSPVVESNVVMNEVLAEKPKYSNLDGLIFLPMDD
ncbi:uncharacterized protein PAC_14550 [Phialocephala subalpina]|uniref:Peptidase S1 domain-containing protein n=1 Tax=Phialocephala subalpina TaxID=576137 RepID=A0A1L7XHZ9_9HELO|nr:uncharacterized protein PAC_14550 [Phialocephala subalpina]